MDEKYLIKKRKKIKTQLLIGPILLLMSVLLVIGYKSGRHFLAGLSVLLVPFYMIFLGGIRDCWNLKKFEVKLNQSLSGEADFFKQLQNSVLKIPYLDIYIYNHHILLLGNRTIYIEDLNNIYYIRTDCQSSPPISWTDLVIRNRQNKQIKWEIPHSRDFSPESRIGKNRIKNDLVILNDYLDIYYPRILKKL